MINQIQYQSLLEFIEAKGANLIAVSKRQSIEKIQSLYDWGHRDFGENHVAELLEKQQLLPKDINWHMIGHLQRNKVKSLLPIVFLIHSVDSKRLLDSIEKHATLINRKTGILLQVKISSEETKYGLEKEELIQLIQAFSNGLYPHIRLKGLMGMASNTDDSELIKEEFESLHRSFIEIKEEYLENHPEFKELSMGMSSDYKIALEAKSSMLRIGSTIFGARKN